MNKYKINGSQYGYSISGATLEDAVTTNFTKLAHSADIGNAAGYRLVKVVLAPGPAGHKIGGEPYTQLHIDWTELDLAHRAADPTVQRTTLSFAGRHIEEAQELSIRGH